MIKSTEMTCQRRSGTRLGMSLLVGDIGKVFVRLHRSQVATLYVVRYVTTHPRPPKVTGNEFGRFPLSRVSSYWVIVVGFHDVKSELTVTRDVDLSSIEY